jgi:DNA end-binding protein Ku
MLSTMYYADEIRDFGEIDKGQAPLKDTELDLAVRLIDELSTDEFAPERYHDEYRQRVLDLIQKKAEGKEVTVSAPATPPANVIDLMDALKASLAKTGARDKKTAAKARRPDADTPARKAQATRK